jgi:uncharacterized membrane protein YgdD (TMEM256/DUF423 family)
MRVMNAWLLIAAINGFLAVAAGAFGVHGLRDRMDAHHFEIFQMAAQYQMYHALAMGVAALAMRGAATGAARVSAAFFLLGIVLFSGSLYILALSGNMHGIGIVTPIGGLAFFVGWGALAWAATKVSP